MSFILKLMADHASAPRWGPAAEDGLTPADLDALRGFEERLQAGEKDAQVAALTLREAVERAIRRARASSHGRKALPDAPRDVGFGELGRLPTTSREVLAAAPASLKWMPLSVKCGSVGSNAIRSTNPIPRDSASFAIASEYSFNCRLCSVGSGSGSRVAT